MTMKYLRIQFPIFLVFGKIGGNWNLNFEKAFTVEYITILEVLEIENHLLLL